MVFLCSFWVSCEILKRNRDILSLEYCFLFPIEFQGKHDHGERDEEKDAGVKLYTTYLLDIHRIFFVGINSF